MRPVTLFRANVRSSTRGGAGSAPRTSPGRHRSTAARTAVRRKERTVARSAARDAGRVHGFAQTLGKILSVIIPPEKHGQRSTDHRARDHARRGDGEHEADYVDLRLFLPEAPGLFLRNDSYKSSNSAPPRIIRCSSALFAVASPSIRR